MTLQYRAKPSKKFDWFNVVIISIALLPLAAICGLIYIALHFLIKFW